MAKKKQAVTKKDIVEGLARLGLQAGDHVLVHGALSSFGRIAGGAETIIDALVDVVGPEGTVLAPAFESTDKVFDSATSVTGLGAIPRALCKRRGAVRSRHPLASVAAVGAEATRLLSGHVDAATAHGKGSPYYKLYELGGKILLLGVDQDRSTFLHTAETLARVACLKPQAGAFVDSAGRKRTRTWPHFPGPHRNFIGLQKWMEQTHLTRKTTIGPCLAQVMPCRELLDALLDRLEADPALFLSANPNLPDGVAQRADVLKARWRRCSFVVAADSRFAGQFTEELIDNLKRFGIGRVILSCVNETPWRLLPAEWRKWHLQGFRKAGIRVAAIRMVAGSAKEAGDLLAEARAEALIVPSTWPAKEIAAVARKTFKVFVENTHLSAEAMERMLALLPPRAAGNVRLAFDPLGFVQVGENPFLKSYHTSIRRRIGLLYVNDGLASGRRVDLEEGLAEIKELVSILHCKSFDGIFAIQSAGPGAFGRTMRKFMNMLEETGVW